MVGSIVHCAECGKPFHVEEGSEVMQVARPARWPLGQHQRRRWWFPRWGCAGVVLAGLLLLFLFIFSIIMGYHSLHRPHPPIQTRAATIKVPSPKK